LLGGSAAGAIPFSGFVREGAPVWGWTEIRAANTKGPNSQAGKRGKGRPRRHPDPSAGRGWPGAVCLAVFIDAGVNIRMVRGLKVVHARKKKNGGRAGGIQFRPEGARRSRPAVGGLSRAAVCFFFGGETGSAGKRKNFLVCCVITRGPGVGRRHNARRAGGGKGKNRLEPTMLRAAPHLHFIGGTGWARGRWSDWRGLGFAGARRTASFPGCGRPSSKTITRARFRLRCRGQAGKGGSEASILPISVYRECARGSGFWGKGQSAFAAEPGVFAPRTGNCRHPPGPHRQAAADARGPGLRHPPKVVRTIENRGGGRLRLGPPITPPESRPSPRGPGF